MTGTVFNKNTLLDAFMELGRRAHAAGHVIELSVYGGSALMLTYDWRVATKDVDAMFEADKNVVRQMAREIAVEREWDEDWLNDGVKGFLSAGDGHPSSKLLFGTFPSEDEPGLRVMVAAPEYLLAMKCRAMRFGGVDENSDIDDIRRLAAELGLTTVGEALDLLAEFYPNRLVTIKTQYGLEEIFRAIQEKDEEAPPVVTP